MYLDFFPTGQYFTSSECTQVNLFIGVQRTAVICVANLCKSVPASLFDRVIDAVPLIVNLLVYPDARTVDEACNALTRLVDSFRRQPERLAELADAGLLNGLMTHLANSSSNLR